MSIDKSLVKEFEFSLKNNENIICQRYFNIKKFNEKSLKSLEIKEMMDDLMGVSGRSLKLGLIPELLKQNCIDNCYSLYNSINDTHHNDVYVTLEISRTNIYDIRDKNGDFNLKDLKSEVLISGGFDGKIFHPNIIYGINIRSIISDIIKTIQVSLGQKNYTNLYNGELLENKKDLFKIELEKYE